MLGGLKKKMNRAGVWIFCKCICSSHRHTLANAVSKCELCMLFTVRKWRYLKIIIPTTALQAWCLMCQRDWHISDIGCICTKRFLFFLFFFMKKIINRFPQWLIIWIKMTKTSRSVFERSTGDPWCHLSHWHLNNRHLSSNFLFINPFILCKYSLSLSLDAQDL